MAAYRAALEELTRERVPLPLDLAMIIGQWVWRSKRPDLLQASGALDTDERPLHIGAVSQEDSLMPEPDMPLDPSERRRRALSRWDNEGGAIAAVAQEAHTDVPDMTNAELVLLRVRVIALENLLIAVLAEGSDQQRQAVRDMAEIISPRAGSIQHPLTVRAAQHMADLVDRAVHIRGAQR